MLLGFILIPILLCTVSSAIQEQECLSMYDYQHNLLYKLVTVEEQVKAFKEFLDEFKRASAKRERQQRQLLKAAIETFQQESTEAIAAMKADQENVVKEQEKAQVAALAKLDSATKDTIDDVLVNASEVFQKHEEAILNLTVPSRMPGHVKPIGFSLKDPKEAPRSGQMTFKSVISNAGEVFDLATGEFVCQTPGVYYFSLSLVKAYKYKDHVMCGIKKNNIVRVNAFTNPGHPGKWGNYAATASVYVHLTTGDKVVVGGCSEMEAINLHTSFTGFLVKAD